MTPETPGDSPVAFDFEGRVSGLRALMAERDIDAVLLSVGADLRYFIGYEAMASERLNLLVVAATGPPRLVIPELEASRAREGFFEIIPWRDSEDPFDRVKAILPAPRRLAVGDQLQSSFLLRLQAQWSEASWRPASELTGSLRLRKDDSELALLAAAGRQVDAVMAGIPGSIRFSGRSERVVAIELAQMILEHGHDSVEFTIVASGPNSASPHHEPGSRVMRHGDLVVCDFGGRRAGYFSDTTRTFSVGPPSSEAAEIHSIVADANSRARAVVAPGVACQEVDRVARTVIEDAGYGESFIHRTGHGIGLDVHEPPYIVEGNNLPLEPGMAFSIEPGIYLEGRLGVRVEDIVVCTSDGAVVLNGSNRGLLTVE